MLSVITLSVLLSANFSVQAQQHFNLWLRGTVTCPVHDRLKIAAEIQHRRQNGSGNKNMFDKDLMYTFRTWIHYKYTDDITFSLSPFAYFSNYKIIQKQADEYEPPSHEIRFSLAATLKRALVEKINIFNRTAVEYRLFENNRDIMRLRTRLGLSYDFPKNVRMSIFNELFVNIANAGKAHFFDHNRTGLNLECKLFSAFRIDTGYMYIIRLPLFSATKIQENALFLNLTYESKRIRTVKKHSLQKL
ncbi:MAG: hypothetical protein BGO87_09405 [Flavobacteriia bacterium 40-80]|nr:MAG: hypothetical protein BGO87_09405 [Flavobacteriia bacterium 40-80]